MPLFKAQMGRSSLPQYRVHTKTLPPEVRG